MTPADSEDDDDLDDEDAEDGDGEEAAGPAEEPAAARVVVADPSWQAPAAPVGGDGGERAGKAKPWWKTVPERPAVAAGQASTLAAAALADLADGETREVRGSAAQPYVMKNTGGVYSCSCPAWRNQSAAIERRSCKHLRGLRGDIAEDQRVGGSAATPARAVSVRASTASAASGTAPPLLLAHSWGHDVDLTGWWMSEKLDGVRAYWDGRAFVSRLGNAYFAPDWFTAGLPDTPLDGELWGGRKRFQRTVSVVRRQDRSDDWKEITYVVFDAPKLGAPFEERLAFVRAELERRQLQYARSHDHAQCLGLEHLKEELSRVEALGGEGLMMRRPGSRYEVGRSSTLLKVKSFHDAEGRVIGHAPGAGRHKGRLGALLCEMPNGTRFSIGTGLSDAERQSPPAIGSIVTYRYQELSEGGVPRFPSYVGVRHDVAWPAPDAARIAGGAAASAAPMSPAPRPNPVRQPAQAGSLADSLAASLSAPSPTAADARRFMRMDGERRLLWEIELAGPSHTVRLWRGDALVETRTSQFPSASSAWRDAERLIGERTTEGFVEQLDALG